MARIGEQGVHPRFSATNSGPKRTRRTTLLPPIQGEEGGKREGGREKEKKRKRERKRERGETWWIIDTCIMDGRYKLGGWWVRAWLELEDGGCVHGQNWRVVDTRRRDLEDGGYVHGESR